MKLYYVGSVKDGKIKLPATLKKEVVEAFNNKHIKVTFERNKSIRSNSQNRYYWGVVLPYVLDGFIELGNKLQRNNEGLSLIHDLMKSKFLDNGTAIHDMHGELHSTASSTTILNKSEMSDYVDDIKDWAKEFLNVAIPEAGEQIELL